jgi:PAS domain S-box-containing protein
MGEKAQNETFGRDLPNLTTASAGQSVTLQSVGDTENYRMRRTADEFYRRSKRGALFYAISYSLVDSIARYDRISVWLLLLPIGAFLASIWLRTRHTPPGPTASGADYRRWVKHHWQIIYFGLLLWGLIVAAVGWRQGGPDSAVMVALVCTVAHATALVHAYAMYRMQSRLGIVALMGPGAVTFFAPGLGLWPAGIVLSVYLVYLMGTLGQSAKEFDRQLTMEIELTDSAASQHAVGRRLKSALLFQQQLLDAIPIPVFYKNEDLVYLGCNEAYARFLGIDRTSIVGKTVFDVAPPDLARVYHEKDALLISQPGTQLYEGQFQSPAHQEKRLIIFHKATFENSEGQLGGIVGAMVDITEMRNAEKQKEQVISELRRALEKVKLLSGLLPICASCKKIRDDKGYWNQIESYIRAHSEAEFSHGLCPECIHKLYPDDCDDVLDKK